MPNINTTNLSKPSRIISGTYKTTKRCFFFQSKLFEAQITELFDDLWPTITAIKNLRWQVNGYYHEMNVKENSKLASHFVDSDDKTNRPNLYRACIEQTWEQQEYKISRDLLTNIFALYEGWIETILPALGYDKSKSPKFQYPDRARNSLISMQIRKNATLENAMYWVYINQNKGSKLAHLENYLHIYRYFKECRNCIIHGGGITDQKLVDAYNNVKALSATDLDVAEVPIMEPVLHEKDIVKLYLRGVVGFSQIIIKLVEVLDMEFIKTEKAVNCFIRQIKEFTPYPENVSGNKNKTRIKINSIFRRSGFLPPQQSDDLYNLLKNEGILKEHL